MIGGRWPAPMIRLLEERSVADLGILYLIPTPLGNIDPEPSIPLQVRQALATIDLFVVEKPKTAMHFLGRMGLGSRLEECVLVAADRLNEQATIHELLDDLLGGRNIGVLSEAGCPGVADPGTEIVRAAHSREISVVPLVGPSSIVLSLMASGLNGQEFAFHGYLPSERQKRIAALRRLEQSSRSSGYTQIFIEAPHRNQHLFGDILHSCRPETLLCVALDLTLPTEYIRTKSIDGWRRSATTLAKRPAIFLINARR